MSEGSIADVLAGRATFALVEGDCREVLPTLPDKSVAHVITDPPYSRDLYLKFRSNSKARGVDKHQGTNGSANYLALANQAIGAIEDVAVVCGPEFVRIASRWIVVFHDAESGHLWREQFGDTYVRAGVWVKPNPVPQISGDRPGQGFESVCIAHQTGKKRWNGGGHAAVWSHMAIGGNWAERVDHPCPKPVSLMLEMIEQFTDPGDVVVDPFCGSGTTGLACQRLGRRFIGIERSAEFCALARERILGIAVSKVAGQTSIFDVLDVPKRARKLQLVDVVEGGTE